MIKVFKILEEHKKWLCKDGGKRANLRHEDLSSANLSYADLRYCSTEFIRGQKIISVQVDTSRKNNRISYWADLEVWTTGCFQGSLEELRESIKETHKDNLKFKTRYKRVIEFILKESEAEGDDDNKR